MNATFPKGYAYKAIVWSLVFLAILELAVRSLIYKTPPMQQHLDLGLIPESDSYYVWGTEGFGVTHFLADGEVVTPYTNGSSVVVLGDSFTEALQVNDNQKYVSVAESILWERGVKVDLHNLGAAGRNVADYVYMAPFIREKFQPRVIVLQISRDDFLDSLKTSRSNYFSPLGTSLELVHQEVDYKVSLQNLTRSSSLVSFSIHQMGSIADEFLTNYVLKVKSTNPRAESANSQPPPQNEFLDEQLQALHEAYAGTDLVLIVVPSVPQISNGSVSLEFLPDDMFVERIKALGFQIVLYPKQEFIYLYQARYLFPRGFSNSLPGVGHLNVYGHQILGEMLAAYLEEILQ